MLVFLLKRLQDGLPLDDYTFILATTKDKEDDIIECWGRNNHIDVIRGEKHDVLKRYMRCLERYPSEVVVRVTADNPFTCPKILNRCVTDISERKADYVLSQNYPKGAGCDVFTADTLGIMDREATAPYEKEHINAFVLNHPERFTILFSQARGTIARPDLNISVDTKQDWERINAIFILNEKKPWRISLDEVIVRMDSSAASQS